VDGEGAKVILYLKQQVPGQRKEIQTIAAEVLRADTPSGEALSMQSVALRTGSGLQVLQYLPTSPVVAAGAIDEARPAEKLIPKFLRCGSLRRRSAFSVLRTHSPLRSPWVYSGRNHVCLSVVLDIDAAIRELILKTEREARGFAEVALQQMPIVVMG
jgi:hypothetical protein